MHSVAVGGLGCVIMGIVVSVWEKICIFRSIGGAAAFYTNQSKIHIVGAYDWVINSNLGSHGYHRFAYWFIRFQYTDDRALWLIAVDCFKC